MTVIASQVLANGLRNEFADTYLKIRNRQASSMLGRVMDLGIGATNRQHEFAYFNAAPHIEHWPRGSAIPEDAFDSVQFTTPVYNWGRRVKWHKDDRADDQTQSLMQVAQAAGDSAGLLPERFFFDLIQGTTGTLPGVPTAPDGAVMYATTAGGAARFGATNGNLLTGSGVSTVAQIRADYYSALAQALQFQDGKGQPLFDPMMLDQGVLIIHGAAYLEVFEETFYQQRQNETVAISNLTDDANRRPILWPTQRIANNDWYVFFLGAPKMPTYLLDRTGIKEYEALEGDNNSDSVRTTGYEYVQWETRQGAGIALPYGTIKINNT